MAKEAQPTNPFKGYWRITSMTQWDQEFVDEEVEGHFEFGPNNMGSFQFGYVQGQIDYRTGVRDKKPCVEFTWEGSDEMTPVEGRGWAILDGDEITGILFFHQGDETEFKAKKAKRK